MNTAAIVVALIASAVPIVVVGLTLRCMIGKVDEGLVMLFGVFVGLAAALSPVIVTGMILDKVA